MNRFEQGGPASSETEAFTGDEAYAEQQRKVALNNEAWLIEQSRKIPDSVGPDVLAVLQQRLEESMANHKMHAGENLKYAIPFEPLFEALDKDNPNRKMDVAMGVTGINVPVGLALAFNEATQLLRKYRLIGKTRREIREREAQESAE